MTRLVLPELPRTKIYPTPDGPMDRQWQDFFLNLYTRVGGFSTGDSDELEVAIVTGLFDIQRDYGQEIDELRKSIETLSSPQLYDGMISDVQKLIATEALLPMGDTDPDLTSEVSWSFKSPSGASGTFYYGGYYIFGATDNDFNPSTTLGTANASYAAHAFLVQAAGASGGVDTVIRVTGTSITDAGVRTAADTEDLTVDDAGAAGTYYETSKKWIGQVTIAKQSGPDLLCNYGFCKYWDNHNTDFRLVGVEIVWLGGANDATPDFGIRHHKATGWTYNNGATPTPPAYVVDMNTDHNTEIQTVSGEDGAWKRDNLTESVNGASSEGIIFEVVTSANKAFDLGNILLKIRSH